MALVAAGGMFTDQGAAGRRGAVKQARGGPHQNPEAVSRTHHPWKPWGTEAVQGALGGMGNGPGRVRLEQPLHLGLQGLTQRSRLLSPPGYPGSVMCHEGLFWELTSEVTGG